MEEEPAEQDALGVRVAEASPPEPRDVAPQVRVDQLERDDDAEGRREEERGQRGDAVRMDEFGLDVRDDGIASGQTRTPIC